MQTTAEVSLAQANGGYAIPSIHLTLTGRVPGTDQPTFEALASKAKVNCPVSKLLKAAVTLTATLEA